jgi:MFS family permease
MLYYTWLENKPCKGEFMNIPKLNIKRTIIIGFAFMSISGLWYFYNNTIPLILKDFFGWESKTLIGVVMALNAWFGLFMLPLFGYLSDKTKTRFGKRLPFILGGALVGGISVALIPFLGVGNPDSVFWFILILVFAILGLMSFRTPAVALMPDVTLKPHRGMANAIINIMGVVGGLIAMVVMMFLGTTTTDASGAKHIDITDMKTKLGFVIIAALIIIPNIILFFTVKENKLVAEHHELQKQLNVVEEEDNKDAKLPKDKLIGLGFLLASVFLWFMAYNALETWYSTYALTVLHLDLSSAANAMMISMIFGFIAFIPASAMALKFGRKKAVMAGILIMIAGLVCICFAAFAPFLFYVAMAVVGAGWATINASSFTMIVELAKNGNVGRYTGIYYTASYAAQSITPFLSGAVSDIVTAGGGSEESGLVGIFVYAIVFMALAFVTMFFAKYGNTYKLGAVVKETGNETEAVNNEAEEVVNRPEETVGE